MGDFLSGCNDRNLPVSDFMDTFCKRCRNRKCVHAGWAEDRFSVRVSTQEERFFNPHRADPNLPKYLRIVQADFEDMLHKAMQLEIADQRGDWEIPEIPILDGVPSPATPEGTSEVDDAVRVLAAARGREGPELPSPTPKEPPIPTPEPPPPPETRKAPAPSRGPREGMVKVVMTLPRGNTDFPAEGMMIDGSPVPPPPEEKDPWAIPDKKVLKIPVGGKVVMGEPPPEEK